MPTSATKKPQPAPPIDLEELDIDAVADLGISNFSGNRTLTIPFMVKSYDTSSLIVAEHSIMVLRQDDLAEGVVQKPLFLDPKEPPANPAKPNSKRMPISAFEYRPLGNAFAKGDTNTIMALSKNVEAKTYTEIGGMILAEVIREEDDRYVARWISPLKRSPTDEDHIVHTSWATYHVDTKRDDPTKHTYYAERMNPAAVVVARNFDEIVAVIHTAYNDIINMGHGKPALYLRAIRADGTAKLLGSDKQTGSRFELRDQRMPDGSYAPRTAEDGVNLFKETPLGKTLVGKRFTIEVIPVMMAMFGEKAAEDAKGRLLNSFTLPPGPVDGETPGWSYSTLRLVAGRHKETNEVTGYFAVGLRPVNGELFALADIPTDLHKPSVEPRFPVRTRDGKKPLDITKPMADDFDV